MIAEPLTKVGDKFTAVAPSDDAAGFQHAKAFAVDWFVVAPMLHRIALCRIDAPIIREVLRRAEHRVHDHGVDGRSGQCSEQFESIAVEHLVEELLDHVGSTSGSYLLRSMSSWGAERLLLWEGSPGTDG